MEVSKQLQPESNIDLVNSYQKELGQQIGTSRKAMLLHYTDFLKRNRLTIKKIDQEETFDQWLKKYNLS